jgi:cytochrome oxidase Cu insertion factor (SCO1/SenC/PrrC family)
MHTFPQASRAVVTLAALLTTGLLAGCGQDHAPLGQAGTQLGSPASPGGPAQTSVEVGKPAPKFRLQDQNGQERSLDDLLKGGKVALVFFRSASW